MAPLPMASWGFLFGLTISCVLMWGAGAETPQAAPHDKWRSEQGLPHNKWRSEQGSEQGVVSAENLQNVLAQFIYIKAQFQKARDERHREQEARSAWETQASRWHTSLLAIEDIVLLLLICCGLRIRRLRNILN